MLPVTKLHSGFKGLCLESIARRYAPARRPGKTLAAQAVLVTLGSTRTLFEQGPYQADFSPLRLLAQTDPSVSLPTAVVF